MDTAVIGISLIIEQKGEAVRATPPIKGEMNNMENTVKVTILLRGLDPSDPSLSMEFTKKTWETLKSDWDSYVNLVMVKGGTYEYLDSDQTAELLIRFDDVIAIY